MMKHFREGKKGLGTAYPSSSSTQFVAVIAIPVDDHGEIKAARTVKFDVIHCSCHVKLDKDDHSTAVNLVGDRGATLSEMDAIPSPGLSKFSSTRLRKIHGVVLELLMLRRKEHLLIAI